jgi:hypothetical protein
MTSGPGHRRRRRVWALMAALALAAGCGDGRDAGRAGQGPATTPAPTTTVTAVSKSCLGAAERDKLFRFTTSDEATLVGVVLGRGRSGLVLGHQLGSDLCEWLPQARAFAERGHRVLLFDFAGFGDSQHGPADSRVDTDVVAAADDQPFLEQARELRDAARVRDPRLLVIPGGGHGTSMLEFGEDAPRVRAVVQGFIAEQTRH